MREASGRRRCGKRALNERYNDKNVAPQYDPEAARVRRALRAQKVRRSRQKRLRRLALLLVLAVCAALAAELLLQLFDGAGLVLDGMFDFIAH